ncbi:MAG: hypothetical protein Q3985_03705 [Eubacteriales bacterium]|nr:hypothetical protein [Eubacteriales bacterium]
MKKRITALFLAFVLVLSLCPTAFATAKIGVDKTAVKAGEQVVVTLTNETELNGITNLDYTLFFNDSLFELTSSSKKGAVKGIPVDEEEDPISFQLSNLMTLNEKPCYHVNLVDSTSEGLTVPAGTLYTLTFTAKSDLTAQQSSAFTLALYSVMDTTFKTGDAVDPALKELVKVTSDAASVTVTPAVAYEGYAVSISEDQTMAVGETATVKVSVNSENFNHFNAFDMQFSYDTSKLELDTTSLAGFTVSDKDGTVRVQVYGESRSLGQAFVLSFKAIDAGEAKVKVTSAKVDKAAGAVGNDAPNATLLNDTVTINVTGYAVNLSEHFTGDEVVAPGADYTFTAKDLHYDYVITATMGDENATVIDNGDGTYTIKNVNGNLEITDTKTPKTYDVTVTGDDTDKVTALEKATYLADYTFTVPAGVAATDTMDGYSYSVAVTVDGKEYNGYTAAGNSYTIPGKDVTGAVNIAVTKTTISAGYVPAEVAGDDVTGVDKAEKGKDYTFTVNKKAGYDYAVNATMGGVSVPVIDNGNGTYTIKNVTGPIVINVTKTAQKNVDVCEYVKLDGKVMYLVTVTGTVEEGKTFAYDENAMYISTKYNEGKNTYCYLVISDKNLTDMKAEAAEKVTQMAATAETVSYDGDVNGTAVVDINDAQLTYDMYNAKYTDFTTVSMVKFLRADVNGSKSLNTADAAAIVAAIK